MPAGDGNGSSHDDDVVPPPTNPYRIVRPANEAAVLVMANFSLRMEAHTKASESLRDEIAKSPIDIGGDTLRRIAGGLRGMAGDATVAADDLELAAAAAK